MLFIHNDPLWSQTASDFGDDHPLRYIETVTGETPQPLNLLPLET